MLQCNESVYNALSYPSSSDEGNDKLQESQGPKEEQQLQSAQKKTGVLTSVFILQFLTKTIENKKKTKEINKNFLFKSWARVYSSYYKSEILSVYNRKNVSKSEV